jgi:ferritin-like metal-binding protein YciE
MRRIIPAIDENHIHNADTSVILFSTLSVMKEENARITTLHNLLDYDVRKFIVAEIQLRDILPEWIAKTSSLKLKSVLQKYLNIVQLHAHEIESFIDEERITSLSTSNAVMNAFITDTDEKLNNCEDAEIKDACLLASIQTINHFKISIYGTIAAFATALSMDKFASVFHAAKATERRIDDQLSQLAECQINPRAKVLLHRIK